MTHTLWGGRFKEKASTLFHDFNESLSFDHKLMPWEIKVSLAFTKALQKKEVLSPDEGSLIEAGLKNILNTYENDGSFIQKGIEKGIEDIHSFVEAELQSEVGSLALKLNTGRSRNEQVSTTTRLYVKNAIANICDLIAELQHALLSKGEEYLDSPLPGYTHLQRAQVILWGHYFHSFIVMFERDYNRLGDALKRTDCMPLGSGAIAGNSWQLDRDFMAKELGFSKLSQNSLDATSDRDFVVEFIGLLSLVCVHLSRLAEDLIIYSSKEFGFVELSDQVSTGSSLMPQKKNPDSLELIRGKAGRVFGAQQAMLTTMKALPSCYNKDLQEDKEALFDAVETASSCLQVMTIVIKTLTINKANCLEAASTGYLNATELADYLSTHGIAFRQSHEIVGRIVTYAISQGKELHELSLEEIHKFYPEASNAVFEDLSVKQAIESKDSIGGTNAKRVAKALQDIYHTINIEEKK